MGVGVDLGLRLPDEENPPRLEAALTAVVPIPLVTNMDKTTRTFRILIPSFDIRRYNVGISPSQKLLFCPKVLCSGDPRLNRRLYYLLQFCE